MNRKKNEEPPHVRRDVHDEVAFHLEMQIRELVESGWAEERAREEAVRRFGDWRRIENQLVELGVKRERRRSRAHVVSELVRDLGYALRGLRKRPGFAAVSILTLAIGIGATSAVFALVDGALLRPLPFADETRLVVLQDVQPNGARTPLSRPEFEDWQREADFFDAMVAYGSTAYVWTGNGEPETVYSQMVLGDPLRTLGLRAVVGRGFTSDEMETGAKVVMVAERVWRQRFGGRADVLGRSVTLDDAAYTIIGVVPEAGDKLRAWNPPEFWMPMARTASMTRGLHFINVIARLSPDVTLETAGGRVAALAEAIRATQVTTHGMVVNGLRAQLMGGSRTQLRILAGAVLVVLLTVCVNVANLVLARSLERAREFAVRLSLGAERRRLLRQIVTESVLLGLVGGAGGIGVAFLLARVVNTVSLTVGAFAGSPFDGRLLAFTLVVSLLSALGFGLWPALRIANTDVSIALRAAGDARSLGGRGALARRRLLTGAQLALCVVLLAAAGLLVRSMANLMRQETGFDGEHTLTFSLYLPGARYSREARAVFQQDLLERLSRIGGVTHAALASHLPLDQGDTNGGIEIIGRSFSDDDSPITKKRVVTPEFFAGLRIPVLQGRAFTEADRGSPEVAIVTASVARKYWPDGDAVGQRIRFFWGSEGEQEIVGVVGDVKHDGLDAPSDGMVYVPMTQFPLSGFNVVLRTTGDPLAILDAVRAEIRAADAALPLDDVRTMQEIVAASVAGRETTMRLFSGFALIALLLAVVGVYAVAAQNVQQRAREIGLRMAIGAERPDVLRLILRQELPGIIVAALLGLLVAVAATRVLRASLFEVAPDDPVTLGAAVLLLVTVALLAILIPALRAARLDPLRTLRME